MSRRIEELVDNISELQNLFNALEELPAIKELLIKDEFRLNPALLQFRKNFTIQLADESLFVKNLNVEVEKTVIPKIQLVKYLITGIERDRDIFREYWTVSFILLDVCAAIRNGQKLSKNALEKAKDYVMEIDNDAEILFRYKQALIDQETF